MSITEQKNKVTSETESHTGNKVNVLFGDKSIFEQALKSLNVLCDEITIEFSVDEILIRTMDPSHVALTDIVIKKEDVPIYGVEQLTKVGVRVDNVLKILEQIDKKNNLSLYIDSFNELHLSDDNGFKAKTRLIECSSSTTPLPRLSFDVNTEINEKDIINLKKLSKLGDYVTIDSKPELILFKTKSDYGECEQKIDITNGYIVKEDSIATYTLDYLLKFFGSFSSWKNQIANIEYSSKMPLRVEKLIGKYSRIHFYLAPRIQD